jgi:hypothetical protein
MVPPIYRTSPPLLLVVALSQPKLCPITLCHVAQRFDLKWGVFFYHRQVRPVLGEQAPTEIMSNNVVPRGTTFD